MGPSVTMGGSYPSVLISANEAAEGWKVAGEAGDPVALGDPLPTATSGPRPGPSPLHDPADDLDSATERRSPDVLRQPEERGVKTEIGEGVLDLADRSSRHSFP